VVEEIVTEIMTKIMTETVDKLKIIGHNMVVELLTAFNFYVKILFAGGVYRRLCREISPYTYLLTNYL